MLTQAAEALRRGDGHQGVISLLEADPNDALALALARLGRTLHGEKS